MEEGKECYHESSFTDKEGKVRTIRVPVVQELARQGLQSLPERFIVTTESASSFQITQDRFVVLPTISMAILKDGSESKKRNQELNKLANAARDLGLFLIGEHGIPCEVLSGVKEVVKGFFDLSFQEKKAAVGTYASIDNMGYGRNYVKSDQPLDWIDRLTMKAAPPPEAEQNLRVWPQKPPNFREAMLKYVAEARVVMDNLLAAMGEALSPENHDTFLRYFDPKDSEIKVRVNYYPKCPRPDLVLGITQHSDPSALTLLMQLGSNQGLQVLNHNNWVNVSWPQDQLLVNAGDLLEIMSNGHIKSPWHRAVTQSDVDRCSIALFYNPPSKAQIEPIKHPACDRGAYKKVVVEDYVQHYSKMSPVKAKTPINFAKVNSS